MGLSRALSATSEARNSSEKSFEAMTEEAPASSQLTPYCSKKKLALLSVCTIPVAKVMLIISRTMDRLMYTAIIYNPATISRRLHAKSHPAMSAVKLK